MEFIKITNNDYAIELIVNNDDDDDDDTLSKEFICLKINFLV